MLMAGITHLSKRDAWVFWLLDVDNSVCGHLTRSGIAQNRNCESFCGEWVRRMGSRGQSRQGISLAFDFLVLAYFGLAYFELGLGTWCWDLYPAKRPAKSGRMLAVDFIR